MSYRHVDSVGRQAGYYGALRGGDCIGLGIHYDELT